MKPILFNTAMVQAILEGRKTTTRRIVKNNTGWHPPINYKYVHFRNELNGDKDHLWCGFAHKGCFDNPCYCKAPYMLGDILYVRETWKAKLYTDSSADAEITYRADDAKNYFWHIKDELFDKLLKFSAKEGWQPSLFMPREVARIFLKVTDVRVERLQDMREKELRAEGITPDKEYEKFKHAAEANLEVKFATLWDSTINKKDLNKYGWEANPWVWVIEFERCEKPND